MKKIIILMMMAVSLLAFIGCKHNNSDEPTATPAELLKNIPITEADFSAMLNANGSRSGDSNENSEPPSNSDLILGILKTLVSEKAGLEFGKNQTIGVIGTFSDNAKEEFAKIYGEDTDEYLKSYSKRNFGSVRINIEDDNATIFWNMPENHDDDMTFPECSIYINGTYKNGNYESIEIYGEGYSYGKDTNGNFKAFPIYEKKYVSGNKVICKSVILNNSSLSNNQVNVIEITASGKTESKVAYSNDLPKQSDIDGFSKKISEWKKSLN